MQKLFKENNQNIDYGIVNTKSKKKWNSFSKPLSIDYENGNYMGDISSKKEDYVIGELVPEIENINFNL